MTAENRRFALNETSFLLDEDKSDNSQCLVVFKMMGLRLCTNKERALQIYDLIHSELVIGKFSA